METTNGLKTCHPCLFYLISCSHFLDNTVQVWDFRRPYIPFASFTEHSDDVTGRFVD